MILTLLFYVKKVSVCWNTVLELILDHSQFG